MKNILLLLVAIFVSNAIWSQSSGEKDSTFATDGMLQKNITDWDFILATALQDDGKIVATGYTQEGDPSQFFVMRVLPDGNPDLDFGVDGIVRAKISEMTNEATCIAIQTDGKILIGGFTRPEEINNEDFALLRFTPEGDPDTGFGQNGVVTLNIGTGNHSDRLQAIAVLPDGKIIAAGVTTTTKQNFVVMRFLPDGTLDTDFGLNEGYTITSVGIVYDVCSSLTVQPDGKILLAGAMVDLNSQPDIALVRYNPNGTLDNTFDSDGIVTTAFSINSDIGLKVILQPDAKIIVAGLSNNIQDEPELALFRYLPDGSLDPQLNGSGKLRSKIGDLYSAAATVCVRPDGRILAAGYGAFTDTGFDIAMKQFKPNGSVDNSFGTNGIVTANLNGKSDGVSDIFFLGDGKILVTGTGYNNDTEKTDLLMLRYLSDLYVGVIEASQSISAPWVYPNPISTPTVQVKYDLRTAGEVVFELYAGDGKLLGTLHQGEKMAGEQVEELLLPPGLNNGHYILNIRTPQGNAVIKILINRQ